MQSGRLWQAALRRDRGEQVFAAVELGPEPLRARAQTDVRLYLYINIPAIWL